MLNCHHKRITRLCSLILMAAVAVCGLPMNAQAGTLRLKDITHIQGVRDNMLVGYGLVVGLSRTGDQSRATQNAQYNLIQNFGGRLNSVNDVLSFNSASVMVTAVVPPFAKPGDKIDVMVSAMADAKSLEGGTLINTQLIAPNGEVVAIAQGPISVGGVNISSGGSSKRTAITTSGRIPNGAIIEREIMTDIGDDTGMELVLGKTDFTLASRIAEVVTQQLAPARATDGGTVRVLFPDEYVDNRVAFIGKLENIEVENSAETARVVVNERTGTIVIGNKVRLLPAAVAHGGITVTVKTENTVSQPGAFAEAGETVGVTNSEIEVTENPGALIELESNANLTDLVAALNAIGAKPNDLISILQALRASGSLEAQLEII